MQKYMEMCVCMYIHKYILWLFPLKEPGTSDTLVVMNLPSPHVNFIYYSPIKEPGILEEIVAFMAEVEKRVK